MIWLLLLLFMPRATEAGTACQFSCVVLSGYNCTEGPPGPAGPPGTNATLPTTNYALSGTLTAGTVSSTSTSTTLFSATSATATALVATSTLELPVHTTTAKLALPSPAAGTLVYDSTLQTPSYYDGGAWRQREVGELSFTGVLAVSTMSSTGTARELLPTYTLAQTASAFANTANRLVYSGPSGSFVVSYTAVCALSSTSTSAYFQFDLRKGGVVITGTTVRQSLVSITDYETAHIRKLVTLATGDSLSIWGIRLGGANVGVTCTTLSLMAESIN